MFKKATQKLILILTLVLVIGLLPLNVLADDSGIGAPIPGWGAEDEFDAGNKVGTVTVIIENFTYDDGYFYNDIEKGEPAYIHNEGYPLGENDSMMSVACRALREKGCTWNGEGKTNYKTSYLASIHKDGYSLGEFEGGWMSGWMGTLNDWFTNNGFAHYKVSNGNLVDGDIIHLMYTSNGYGEDLGGSWGNKNTTLKSLTAQGGELSDVYESSQEGVLGEYDLTISADTPGVKLNPTATNKNFLVKMFLNQKITTNDEPVGVYYKRTQTIPVKIGDKVYIGIGEAEWPTMNNDPAGSWYIVNIKENPLDILKKAAIEELEAYKNPEDYRENERNQLEQIIEDGSLAIKEADDEQAVEDALASTKTSLDALKTAEQLHEEDLMNSKENLKLKIAEAAAEKEEKSDYSKEDYKELKKALKRAKSVDHNRKSTDEDRLNAINDLNEAMAKKQIPR